MTEEQLNDLLHKGIDAAENGHIHSAQVFLGQIDAAQRTPEVNSYLAYCLAKGQGRLQAAARICQESLQKESHNSVHYLLLGRILLLAGKKDRAISSFRKGLKAAPDRRIIAELKQLGLRKPLMIKSLKRSNPLNRTLGKAFHRLGLR